MPFREKMKKAFGRSPSTSSTSASPLTLTSSNRSKKEKKKEQAPDNIYKPGEMPASKYRGPVNKAHQEMLSTFSFSDAWAGRRKSGQSQYSPMGSRMPSRVGSPGSLFGGGRRSRRQSHVQRGVEEMEGDDDVGNVGLSRQHTASPTANDENWRSFSARHNGTGSLGGLETARTITNGEPAINGVGNAKPFSEDELTLALTKTALQS
ncbi:hypothetical protein MMC08_005390 [Hypocenomyce scalaris]|nr:hypothetical protein [Hypocenomyce scalaris]